MRSTNAAPLRFYGHITAPAVSDHRARHSGSSGHRKTGARNPRSNGTNTLANVRGAGDNIAGADHRNSAVLVRQSQKESRKSSVSAAKYEDTTPLE